VHHAVADEPVIQRRIDFADGIGPVAQVPTVQIVRDGSHDLQVGEGVLLVQWGEVALQVAVRHRG
jgi:hypothetical protein